MTLALAYRVSAVPSDVPGAPAAPSVQYTRYALANPSVVDLSVTATNATGADVTLTDLTLELPTADSAAGAALTTTPPPSAAAPPGWQCRASGASYRFVPGFKHHTLAAGASLTFTFPGVTVATRTTPGTAALAVTETGAAVAATGTVDVALVEPRCAFITDSLEPAARKLGDPAPSTLAWATWPGVESVTLHHWLAGPAGGFDVTTGDGHSLATRGSLDEAPQATTNYQLVAHGGGSSTPGAIHTLTVETVAVSASVDPGRIGLGGSFTLTWRADFDPGFWSGLTYDLDGTPLDAAPDDNGASGTRVVTVSSSPPANPVVFIVSVRSGATVVAQTNVLVTMLPPALADDALTCDPAAIGVGESATLTWKPVLHTTGVRIDAEPGPGLGSVSADGGRHTVTPKVDTTYTLTADGYGPPATARASARILPVTVRRVWLGPEDGSVGHPVAPQPVWLDWQTASAKSVTCWATDGLFSPQSELGPAQPPDGHLLLVPRAGEVVGAWQVVGVIAQPIVDGQQPAQAQVAMAGKVDWFPILSWGRFLLYPSVVVLYEPDRYARMRRGGRVTLIGVDPGVDRTFHVLGADAVGPVIVEGITVPVVELRLFDPGPSVPSGTFPSSGRKGYIKLEGPPP